MEWLLEAAARLFRREGMGATTNRIAAEAGVGIGTLYEYFADKHALLRALALAHVELAESGMATALEARSAVELVGAARRAVLASHRFPSEAVVACGDAGLQQRVEALRGALLGALRACAVDRCPLRARAAFGAVAELPSLVLHTEGLEAAEALGALHDGMALAALGTVAPG